MKSYKQRLVRTLCVVGLGAVSTIGLVAPGAGAQSASVPGVTAKTVKIGFIYDGTGAAGSTFKNSGDAFQARVDRANAQGGVNGRRIEAEIVDDQTSGANLTGAQDLVQNRHVFMVVNNSGVGFLSYRYLLGAGVPMIGGGFDGAYYSQKGNENIITATGYLILPDGLVYNTIAKLEKRVGATKSAVIAVSTPGSANASQVFQQFAPKSVGMEAVYTNTTLDLGTTDVGSPVLGVKNSGADAVYMPITASTVIAIMQALKQNGVDTKANIGATGYGQELLDSPAAASLESNDIFGVSNTPVELKTKATKQFQADLKKYAHYTGVPDYGQYTGYITADLAIKGLELAGKNPTRQGFIDAIRNNGKYDGAGLLCEPVDLSLEAFGKFPKTNCSWFANVKDGKFVFLNSGKPITGELIGDPAALAANASGAASATTTTAAAP